METTLTLNAYELCALIEALYDSLLSRIKWTVQRKERRTPDGWTSVDWMTAQATIDQLASAYAKAFMALKSIPDLDLDPNFEKTFTPPPELWDLLNQISLAQEWSQAPTHEIHDNCPVCYQLAQV